MNTARKFLTFIVLAMALIGAAFTNTACNKAILHARDKEMDPEVRLFSAPPADAFKASKEALVAMGYKISRESESEGTLLTGWKSTKADSHYIDLFDRRDYGTVGAYYQIKVKVGESNGKSEVAIATNTKSIISGRLRTSYYEENRVLGRIADLLRKDDFDITNVGPEE